MGGRGGDLFLGVLDYSTRLRCPRQTTLAALVRLDLVRVAELLLAQMMWLAGFDLGMNSESFVCMEVQASQFWRDSNTLLSSPGLSCCRASPRERFHLHPLFSASNIPNVYVLRE